MARSHRDDLVTGGCHGPSGAVRDRTERSWSGGSCRWHYPNHLQGHQRIPLVPYGHDTLERVVEMRGMGGNQPPTQRDQLSLELAQQLPCRWQ